LKKILLSIILIMILLQTKSIFADDNFSVKKCEVLINQEILDVNVEYPYFEGYNGSEQLNESIRAIIADSIGDATYTADEIIKENAEIDFKPKVSLNIAYEYKINNHYISVQLYTDYYSGGAHPISWVNSYVIDTESGEVIDFKDIFSTNTEYKNVIENKIISEIDNEKDYYFEDYFQTISNKNGDFKYLINENSLVVYFDLYEIAPYAYGMPTFVFKFEDIKEILKTDIYDNFNESGNKGLISFNGIDLNSENELLNKDNTLLLPLRDVAEALGYDVGWNRDDGAIIASGFIKNGVNSYWRSGKSPIKLVAPVVVKGVTYVPIQYFTDVLEENITFGYGMFGEYKTAVRAYGSESFDNNFDNLIKDYKSVANADEAVNMFANAVKMRNGVVQFGLMSDELRKDNYANLSDLNFVTEILSPWAVKYEISNTNNNDYVIKFNFKTSIEGDENERIYYISLSQVGMYWKVESLVK